MNKLPIASLLLTLVPLGGAQAEVPILPFDEVRPGMQGTGRTVFEGTRIETFDVEVLGTLPNIGPDQDLILARCSGGPLGETRVLSGMSGSPVVIDGRLVGAVAYSWGFSTEAIAGITPIEEMLAIVELEDAPLPPGAGLSDADLRRLASLDSLDSPEPLASFFSERWTRVLERPGSALPVSIPLAVSGLGSAGLVRALPHLASAGFVPVQAGRPGTDARPSPPLEPGAAIGLKLVRGDIEMTATGTATWVDGDRVLAFGHPLFGLGAVNLPLTGARVEALLPSLQQSARIATPLGEVGALRQDRASGVLGQIGARPRMIPIRLQMSRPGGPERTFSFDIADDPALSPLLLYISLNGILATKERSFGNATVRLREGSVIKMLDGEDVAVDNLFAGPAAFDYGTGIAAYILHLLMNNAWTQPRIAGVNMILEYDDAPLTARIRRAVLDRHRVRPGETVEATVVLSPYRGPDQVFTSRVSIPEETPPGPLQVQIGGALAVSRTEEQEEPVLPRDLAQLVALINQLRRNDQIFIVATRRDAGVLLDGTRLPNLPPSVSSVLTRPRTRGNFTRLPRRRIFEDLVPTDYAVAGSKWMELEVEAR